MNEQLDESGPGQALMTAQLIAPRTPDMDAMTIAREPWLFVQSSPLTTADFTKAAEERGLDTPIEVLRALCRHRLLQPAFAVHDRPCSPPPVLKYDEPAPMSTLRHEFSAARREGRLSDPFVSPLPRTWPFRERKASDPRRWWNGLLYSRWQVIELPLIVRTLRDGRSRRNASGRSVVLPRPEDWDLERAGGRRRLALLLTAIESRYAPKLDPAWIRLVNTDSDQWANFQRRYDAAAAARRLGVTHEDAERTAEGLLVSATNLDSLGPWHRVVRHADPKSWERLRGNARLANDLRLAAEMLFLFAEDLAGTRAAPPAGLWWTPKHDRLFRHGEPLDRTLEEFGLSPHTRVTLVVEGESETQTVRRVMDHLGISAHGEEIQIINMRGVGDPPANEVAHERKQRVTRTQFLASHLVTPVVVDTKPDYYVTLRPLAQVRIAADPEGEFANGTAFKTKVLAMVRQNLVNQGADDVDPDSLDALIDVITWDQEFEFAHYSDDELITAFTTLDPTLGGHSAVHVRAHLASLRAKRRNIRHVWADWPSRLSKIKLAEELWPVLRGKIDHAMNGTADAPPIAAVVYQAHQEAIHARRVHFVLPRTKTGV